MHFESAFAVLQTYSLVQFRHDQGGYAMHKLVHAWAYERLELDQQRNLSFAALQLLEEVTSAFDGDPTSKNRLVPHVMANFLIFSSVYSALNLKTSNLSSA